jgi:hypothetical protein
MMTKALMGFNALLTFYILNTKKGRFAQVDADAASALAQATDEIKGSAADALSFGRMFSSAFGGIGGKRSGGSAQGPAAAGGGFDGSPFAGSSPPEPSTWPTGGSGNDA